jgi:hypothetical protein
VPGAAAPTSLPTTGADLYSACTTPDAAGGNTELTSVELVTRDGQLVRAFTMAKPVAGDLRLEVAFGAGHDPAATPAAGKFTVQVSLQDGLPSEAVVQTPSGASAATRRRCSCGGQYGARGLARRHPQAVGQQLALEGGGLWHTWGSGASARSRPIPGGRTRPPGATHKADPTTLLEWGPRSRPGTGPGAWIPASVRRGIMQMYLAEGKGSDGRSVHRGPSGS